MKWLALSFCCVACVGGVPRAQCVFDDECEAGSACFEGGCTPGSHQDGGVAWCPGLQPKFSDIDQRLLKVGCGAKTTYCHNGDAAQNTSGLDFSVDSYARLVNVAADNLSQTAPLDGGTLLRVKPGDPANSFLAIKLKLLSTHDTHYGSGMPPEHPGGVCASAQAAVAQWIQDGAQRN